ncbi:MULTISPECIES: DUF2335 domain-containing protein [Photorhabdus]|uniref:DUF2335 domain-containing protein n=2 Tax=Photorhabdus asymbiotica TaxID=291112 RepID=C7BH00_PHOAA|nr:DUF2335 domain-containing protein [Photorhabdus asymbiotica]RKS66180.1 putative membrane protein [Photorhabdus asymbiotica]CAQ83922.1 conserved hypothetical protein [Photorhabdus asymbiotica]
MIKRINRKHPKITKPTNQGDINPLYYQLPDSEILTLYEQHTKGAADRFLTLIEQQQKHRHEMEKVALEQMVRKSIRGQSYGLLLTFISLFVSLILGLNGNNWLAGIIGSGTVTTILIIYVLNRNPKSYMK